MDHLLNSAAGACSVVIAAADPASAEPVECSPGSSLQSPSCDLRTHVRTPPPETTDPGTRRQSGSQPVTSNAEQKCVSSYSGKEVPCEEATAGGRMIVTAM